MLTGSQVYEKNLQKICWIFYNSKKIKFMDIKQNMIFFNFRIEFDFSSCY